MEQENQFKPLIDEVLDLNKRMMKALVAYVKEHGGLIRTDILCHIEDRVHLPTIYAVLMQSDFAPNHEYPIMAIAVDTDDELMILPDFTEGYTNLGDYTKEQILALDDWMKFSEGYISINVTLYNICELIEQYVKK